MKQWLKEKLLEWLGIKRELYNLHEELNALKQATRYKFEQYDKLTRTDIDLGVRAPCTVVLTGVFQGRGYVQFYEVSLEEFRYLVEDFRKRRKHNLIRNIDAPPHFYGVFDLK